MDTKQLLRSVRDEDARRLSIAVTFVNRLELANFKQFLEIHLSLGRQIAAYFTRFLEGQMLTQDERCQLRFLRESYILGGIIPDKVVQVVPSRDEDFFDDDFFASLEELCSQDVKVEGDPDFGELRRTFERAGLAQPSEEFSTLLTELDVTDSFERIEPLTLWIEERFENIDEMSDEEEEICLIIKRWHFNDRGLSRRLFLDVREQSGVQEFVDDMVKELTASCTEAQILLEALKQLSHGTLPAQQFIDRFNASLEGDDVDIDLDGEMLLEMLGEDVLIKLEDAVLKDDLEDQKRGTRKAKRRATR